MSFSYRGRGLSDTPCSGYDLEEHLGDLEAVVHAAGVESAAILAFSRGIACALKFTLDHPAIVAGLVVVDIPPMQYRWAPGTTEFWKNLVYLGRPVTDFIRPAAIDALEREAREVLFWDDLPRINCPTLVLLSAKPTPTAAEPPVRSG